MNGNDTPRALDEELDEKGTDGEQDNVVGKGPKRDDRKGEKGGDDDCSTSPDVFGEGPEDESTEDGTKVVDNGDGADGGRRIFLLDLEKSWVDVLGSVAERVEGGHQDDDIDK